MPGIAELIEGAIQQAPHSGRHFIKNFACKYSVLMKLGKKSGTALHYLLFGRIYCTPVLFSQGNETDFVDQSLKRR
jgi:hypothetical protein